eukprot:10823876-Heterocapsa_arctica.AAC.1
MDRPQPVLKPIRWMYDAHADRIPDPNDIWCSPFGQICSPPRQRPMLASVTVWLSYSQPPHSPTGRCEKSFSASLCVS